MHRTPAPVFWRKAVTVSCAPCAEGRTSAIVRMQQDSVLCRNLSITAAGHNAAKYAGNEELLILPDTLAVGNIISYSHRQFIEQQIYNERYTFAGGVFFNRMKELDLYSVNVDDITERVERVKMKGMLGEP